MIACAHHWLVVARNICGHRSSLVVECEDCGRQGMVRRLSEVERAYAMSATKKFFWDQPERVKAGC